MNVVFTFILIDSISDYQHQFSFIFYQCEATENYSIQMSINLDNFYSVRFKLPKIQIINLSMKKRQIPKLADVLHNSGTFVTTLLISQSRFPRNLLLTFTI